ncbi:MAG: copper chaperone CopZ [Parvicellaceae bacterium]|jgi:copper chaperone CopZ
MFLNHNRIGFQAINGYIYIQHHIFKQTSKMKKTFFALSIGVSVVLLTGCSSDAASDSESSFIDNTSSVFANATADLQIEGMVCKEGCAGTIEKSLTSMTGVASCSVDFENNIARVDFDDKMITKDEMVEVIQNLSDGQFKVTATDVKSKSDESDEVLESSSTSSSSDVNVSSGGFQVPNFLNALTEVF